MVFGNLRKGAAAIAAAAFVLVAISSWTSIGLPPGSAAWQVAIAASGMSTLVVALTAPRDTPQRQLGWTAIRSYVVLMTIGGLWWFANHAGRLTAAVPAPPDALFLAAYASLIVGAVLLYHQRNDEAPASEVLDGLLLGVSVAAVASSGVIAWMSGDHGAPSLAGAATRIAYPMLDVAFIATLLSVGRGATWRTSRWQLLVAAGAVLLVCDVATVRQSGVLSAGAWYHPLYLLAGGLLAIAASRRAEPLGHRRAGLVRMALVPLTVALAAMWILVWDHFDARSDLSVWLATIALLGVALRGALTVRHLWLLADARRHAHLDVLTGLPGRQCFRARLAERIERGDTAAVLVLGIDRFKLVNDVFGHEVGDDVLRHCATRLVAQLRRDDVVGRLGGDEFGVIPGDGEAGVERAIAAVRRVFEDPIVAEDHEIVVDASIGAAARCESSDAECLLRLADLALADAKQSRGDVARYSADHDTVAMRRITLATDLPGAVAREELHVAFQPIADAATMRYLGAEALVRWNHPTLGAVAPVEFVDLAEEIGVMPELTALVLRRALMQWRTWRAQGLDLPVTVNLSATALEDRDLPSIVQRALDAADAPASALTLEITEEGVIDDPTSAIAVLRDVRDLGVGLAVDDYGTGYASLSYLRDLPVTVLKIDRSFVVGITDVTSRKTAIVRSTVDLAHELGFAVVAEGVEDEATLSSLIDLGVDAIQGFLIARPVEGDEVLRLAAVGAGRARRS